MLYLDREQKLLQTLTPKDGIPCIKTNSRAVRLCYSSSAGSRNMRHTTHHDIKILHALGCIWARAIPIKYRTLRMRRQKGSLSKPLRKGPGVQRDLLSKCFGVDGPTTGIGDLQDNRVLNPICVPQHPEVCRAGGRGPTYNARICVGILINSFRK